ncbi:MAG: Type 1 glutamine amidotransferase-like domain-containing protein [Bacteroidia bacterium]
MRLLLLSNSTNPGEDYLGWPQHHLSTFLGNSVRKILFIPYAGVTLNWDDYTSRVAAAFGSAGGDAVEGIHSCDSN